MHGLTNPKFKIESSYRFARNGITETVTH